MSIYKKVLGTEFYRLHPMLQKRYGFSNNKPFHATGVMKTIKKGPIFLYPIYWLGPKWKLLYPEHGSNIPFTILNTPKIGANGEEQIHWERIFYFRSKKRYFNALMSFDAERNLIKDYLGEPSVLYSDLAFTVSTNGELKIESRKQRFVIGRFEFPLPRIFQGLATVTEKYIEDNEVFHVKVEVKNPMFGLIFMYEGEFSNNDLE